MSLGSTWTPIIGRRAAGRRGTRLAGLVVAALVLLAGTGCSVSLRATPASTTTSVVLAVSADQIASAMQADNFYAAYADAGPRTLRVSGTVAAVSRQPRDLRVRLTTSVGAAVWCDLGDAGASPPSLAVGTAITVEAPAGPAERQGSSVLLVQCRLVAAP